MKATNASTGTISKMFMEAARKTSTSVAFRYKEGATWRDISWPEYFKMSERLAAGLASLGVKRGDRVAILSNTRYQWAVADMGILGMGAITVPVYQSATVEDIEFILMNSQAVAAIIEDEGQFKKVQPLRKNLPDLKNLISITPVQDSSVHSWERLQEMGEEYLKPHPKFFTDSCQSVTFNDVATIVYTSGTTGQPKGVVLPHSAITSECIDIKEVFALGDQDSTLTFLPFAHIFGRVEMWANVYIGWKMCFAESIDRIAANLAEVRPTFMMAVPRIFEKIYSRIMAGVDEGSPIKKKLFNWAVGVGSKVSQYKRSGGTVPVSLGVQYQLAYKLVFSKISARLGGRLKFLVSGGAPLAREIAEFFHAAGILILEGYGLTETTAAICVNTPYKYQFGVVGPALGDVQLKIAEDGEVLVKSAKVFKEYFRSPEATNEVLVNGWFHTGDIGEIDKDGFLKITDRKKDLIKTAGGKMIAPQKLENLLKTNKFISQVVIYGDKMKYLVALVTLNADEVKKYAAAHGVAADSMKDLAKDPKIHGLVKEIIQEKNSNLASFETIKNFAILPDDFTVESGELTPSLKVKRKHLSQKYGDVISALYA